jgi:hypothetical protein
MGRRLGLLLVAAVLGTGCWAHGPLDIWPRQSSVVQAADEGRCGPEPTQAELEDVVRRFAASELKDPESARWRNLRAVRRGQWRANGNTMYGWFVMFELNGKNSFGGYTGFTSEVVLLEPSGTFWHSDQSMTGEFLYSMGN